MTQHATSPPASAPFPNQAHIDDLIARGEVHPSIVSVWRYLSQVEMPLPGSYDSPTAAHINFACCELAAELLGQLAPGNPEMAVGLRKLLEARDCFVRSASQYP